MNVWWNVSIIIFFSVIHTIIAECIDGVHNVYTVDSYSKEKLPVIVRNVTILVYDIHYKPSCHHSKVNVVLPGYFHIISGEVETTRDFDLFSSNIVRATVQYGNIKICTEGESGMVIVPSRLCHFDIRTVIPPDMCRLLQMKGIHTLAEVQEKLNFNSTLELPPSPSFLGISLLDLMKGEYRIRISLDSNDETILKFAIPSGFKTIKMGLHDNDD